MTKHIISASERIDESLIVEYGKLHQAADLATVLHYLSDFNRIFKTRGTKRRTAGEKRENSKQVRKSESLTENLNRRAHRVSDSEPFLRCLNKTPEIGSSQSLILVVRVARKSCK